MSADIPARLREGVCVEAGVTSGHHVDLPATHRLMSEAADEIDRLRDALYSISNAGAHGHFFNWRKLLIGCEDRARAALAATPKGLGE